MAHGYTGYCMDGNVFDLVLLGYRNDVARARTLEFLDQLPLALGPAHVDRRSDLPQRLFTALDREHAQRLRAALEACGAQVALVEVGAAEARPTVAAAPVDMPATRTRGPHPFTVLLVAALGVTTWLWRAGEPTFRQLPLPPRAAPVESLPAHVTHTDQAQPAPDYPEAVPPLQAAPQVDERAAVLRARGITQFREGDYPAAAATLERALQLAPSDPNALLALAETYLKQDKRPQALDLLQRAKEAGVRSAELDKRVQQLSREVDAEWDFVQTESAHFRVSFADTEDGRAVRVVLAALEDAYFAVGDKFEDYPDERTPVVLYTQQDFHNITQTPGWAGAAFDGRIKLPVRGLQADDTQLPRVVRHEYAHSLITQLSRGHAPVWLNEGLAVWAEETEEGERQAWAEQKIAGQELFTLEQMNNTFVNLPAARAEVAYAQSYLAVRALIDEYGTRKIPALLGNLAHSRNMSEAFAATCPDDLASFEARWLRRLTG